MFWCKETHLVLGILFCTATGYSCAQRHTASVSRLVRLSRCWRMTVRMTLLPTHQQTGSTAGSLEAVWLVQQLPDYLRWQWNQPGLELCIKGRMIQATERWRRSSRRPEEATPSTAPEKFTASNWRIVGRSLMSTSLWFRGLQDCAK